jgi:hypothetical protein
MTVAKTPHSVFLLQLASGVFFVFLGLLGILPQYDESFFSLTSSVSGQPLEIVVGLFELAIGAVLILGLVKFLTLKLLRTITLAAFIFWLARLVLTQIIYKLGVMDGIVNLNNMNPVWALETVLMLVLAADLWTLYRRYAAA